MHQNFTLVILDHTVITPQTALFGFGLLLLENVEMGSSTKWYLYELEWQSVERIPAPGWTVYVLHPTDKPDLNPDLNQNLIGLFLSLIHQVSSQFVHSILRYRALYHFLAISLNGWKITLKILRFRSGSSPKSIELILVTHPNPSTEFRPNLSITFWDITHGQARLGGLFRARFRAV